MIADGWNTTKRYLEVDSITGYYYYQVTYNSHE